MAFSSDEWRLRARACRGLARDATDPEIAAALSRAATWFADQALTAMDAATPAEPPGGQDRDEARTPAARAAERVHLSFKAGLRRHGETRFNADIADLSTVGFRVESHYAMPSGTQVYLTLPGLSAVPARVVWSRDNALGCRFDTPLHPAVLERLIAAARSGE